MPDHMCYQVTNEMLTNSKIFTIINLGRYQVPTTYICIICAMSQCAYCAGVPGVPWSAQECHWHFMSVVM